MDSFTSSRLSSLDDDGRWGLFWIQAQNRLLAE
jgi:hypothetical protein